MFEDCYHFIIIVFDQRGIDRGEKEGNQKKEKIRGQIATFVTDKRGLLT